MRTCYSKTSEGWKSSANYSRVIEHPGRMHATVGRGAVVNIENRMWDIICSNKVCGVGVCFTLGLDMNVIANSSDL